MTGQVLFLWEGGGQKIEFAQNPEWSGSIFAMKGAWGIRREKRDGKRGMEKTRNSPSVTSDTQHKHKRAERAAAFS